MRRRLTARGEDSRYGARLVPNYTALRPYASLFWALGRPRAAAPRWECYHDPGGVGASEREERRGTGRWRHKVRARAVVGIRIKRRWEYYHVPGVVAIRVKRLWEYNHVPGIVVGIRIKRRWEYNHVPPGRGRDSC